MWIESVYDERLSRIYCRGEEPQLPGTCLLQTETAFGSCSRLAVAHAAREGA
jgi:hypothetical protein